jgi:hypothetical protein
MYYIKVSQCRTGYLDWGQPLFYLSKVKKKCEPENIDLTSKKGEVSVPMQDVCNHQISKIMNFPDVIEKCMQLNESER